MYGNFTERVNTSKKLFNHTKHIFSILHKVKFELIVMPNTSNI